MPRDTLAHIDFDEWSDLAERDPAAFERRRARVLEEFIDQAPRERQQRLRGLQWQIDRVRDTSPNALSACIRISRMMWEQVTGHRGLLPALEQLQTGEPLPSPKPAQVLELRRTER